eukprot:CAMPEP_0178961698 /NCGR_PEP_ID=MMETSP0789-20121207/13880_1 /TAXON_ID=3005 /ORGANISM="Rhizosolenia setigera, Strain CCMP 1694" /LENGTH=640 /DNA_ID=CAMNT_0020645619 /DNA_START=1273 /DNA_END=3195 /DNA_ORIENTATION=-
MNYGVNAFLGKTPEEQRRANQGDKLFDYTGGFIGSNDKYRVYDQFEDFSTSTYCESTRSGAGAVYITGSAALSFQRTAFFSSVAQFSDGNFFEDFVGLFNKNLKKALTFEGAMVFGNTQGSIEAQANLKAGFEFSYTSYALRTLYSATNNLQNIGSWTSKLKRAVAKLGSVPSDAEVLEFFATYGTHAIKKAIFGQKCEQRVFMEGGLTASAYSSAISSGSIEGLISWDSQGSGEVDGNVGVTHEGEGFSYFTSERVCSGELRGISNCFSGLPSLRTHQPNILDMTYEPIYKLDLPGLRTGAKTRMAEVAYKLKIGALQCSQKYCNGNGACAPKASTWDNIEAQARGNTKSASVDINNFMDFWDGENCFCAENYFGETCKDGYFLNTNAYGEDKEDDQRLKNMVFNQCPPSGIVNQDECEDAAKLLGVDGDFTIIYTHLMPIGCYADGSGSGVLYNTNDSGLWITTPNHISICKAIHTTPESQCTEGTDVGIEECCLAAASQSSAVNQDQYTFLPIDLGSNQYSRGSCTVEKMYHVNVIDGTYLATLDQIYAPHVIYSDIHPSGCFVDNGGIVYYNHNSAETSDVSPDDGPYTLVCMDEIGDLTKAMDNINNTTNTTTVVGESFFSSIRNKICIFFLVCF